MAVAVVLATACGGSSSGPTASGPTTSVPATTTTSTLPPGPPAPKAFCTAYTAIDSARSQSDATDLAGLRREQADLVEKLGALAAAAPDDVAEATRLVSDTYSAALPKVRKASSVEAVSAILDAIDEDQAVLKAKQAVFAYATSRC